MTTLTTITSAFLVTGYVVGHRLTRVMAGAAVAVFTWAFISTAFIASRQIVSLLGLVKEMNDYAAAGKGLAWHAAASPIIGWAFAGTPYFFMLFGAVVFLGSIVFFFHSRRANRKAEAGAWHPKI
jgi:hypothetical protein